MGEDVAVGDGQDGGRKRQAYRTLHLSRPNGQRSRESGRAVDRDDDAASRYARARERLPGKQSSRRIDRIGSGASGDNGGRGGTDGNVSGQAASDAEGTAADGGRASIVIRGIGQDPDRSAVGRDGEHPVCRALEVIRKLARDEVRVGARASEGKRLGSGLHGIVGDVGQHQRPSAVRMKLIPGRGAAETDLAVTGLAGAHILQD